MSVTLTSEARARLDKHLDAVEATLVAVGNSRAQRRGVLDDLEAQILDMLATKSHTPTLPDVEAVLGQLDPPTAYGNPTAPGPVPPRVAALVPTLAPRYSRAAIWGLVCILVSLAPPMIVLPIGFFTAWGFHAGHAGSPHASSESPDITEPQRIAASNAPASAPAYAADMVADRKTYADFMSMLSAKKLVAVAAVTDGNTVTFWGDCRPTPEQSAAGEPGARIFTTVATSALDAEGWRRLRKAVHDSGTTYTVGSSGAPAASVPERTAGPGTQAHEIRSDRTMLALGPCFLVLFGPLGLLGTILGWIAFFQIRNSNGALRGKGLALFDGLFYPCVIILALLFMVLFDLNVTTTGAHKTTMKRVG